MIVLVASYIFPFFRGLGGVKAIQYFVFIGINVIAAPSCKTVAQNLTVSSINIDAANTAGDTPSENSSWAVAVFIEIRGYR